MKSKIAVLTVIAMLISMLSCMLVADVSAQDLGTAAVPERVIYNSAQTLTARSGAGMDTSPTRYGQSNGYEYYVNLDTCEATLTNYYGEETDVELPSEVEGYPVTAIGNYAFAWSNLTSVVIPGSIKKIEYSAFCYSESLASVEIREGVEYLGEYAFDECYALTEVSFPDTLTWIGIDVLFETAFMSDPANRDNGFLYVGRHLVFADETVGGEVTVREDTLTIAGRAFYMNEDITTVTLPEGLVGIGCEAFAGCSALVEIAYPDSIRVLGANTILDTAYEENEDNWEGAMLYNGKHLVQALRLDGLVCIKDGTLTIADEVFYASYGIGAMYIPTDVRYIGTYVITDGMGLGAVAYAGTQEQWNAIDNIPKLSKVPVKFNCVIDGEYTYSVLDDQTIELLYYNGNESETLEIPAVFDGAPVSRIGCYAFAYTSLTGVIIPDTVTSIGDSAFIECLNLTNVEFSASLVSVEAFAFAYTAVQSVILPDTVESIGENVFSSCESLKNVSLSASLKEIGDYAFEYCELLESMIVPEGVQVIGESAFAYCSSLAEITFPSTLKRIGSSVIYGTAFHEDESKMENGLLYIGDCLVYADGDVSGVLTVKEGTYIVADGACYYCTELTQAILPDSVLYLGESAFRDCWMLEFIELPDSILSIGKYAFSNCMALENIQLPSKLTVIEDELFKSTALKTITIPADVTVIKQYAFAWCDALEEVVLTGESLQTIEDKAFCCCWTLKGIEIPEGVTVIGNNAFEDCDEIQTVTLPETLESIGGFAFYSCESITDVYYGGSPSSWAALILGSDNDALLAATLHCAKEDDPVALPGDVDGDGELSSSDSRDFLTVLVFGDMEFTDEERDVLDLNHDDVVNTADIRFLLRMLASE